MHRQQLIVSTTAFLTNFLSCLAQTPVKLDGNPITIGHGGYPRALALEDKTLVASYGTPSSIIVRHSRDNGTTWGKEIVLRDGKNPKQGTKIDLNNAFLYQKDTGELLCAYNRHIRSAKNELLELNLEVSQSNDGGNTWSFLSSVAHVLPKDGVDSLRIEGLRRESP